jgi:hypothetical protein
MEEFPSKPKSKHAKLWISLSVIATALIVGGGIFWFVSSQAEQDKSALQEQIDTLRSKLAAVPTATPIPSVTPSPSPTTTAKPTTSVTPVPTATPNDAEAMKTAAINYIQALAGYEGQKATAKVRTTSGTNFGQVEVTMTNGAAGGVVILKKVNGVWIGLYSGTAQPPKDFGERYGLPAGWYSAT